MWIATYSNGKETLTNIDRINQITCTSWGNRHFIEFHGSPSFRLKFDSKEKAIKTYWKLINGLRTSDGSQLIDLEDYSTYVVYEEG
uniref:hypothetical protein n=1 Tax=uncultured Allisonella sp. TaxID=339338 RepID=UPI0028043000|nr:hypothetical protein [uncultured Allisonella sp.]